MQEELQRTNLELESYKDKIKENQEKIKLNKQLPYLVGNIVEVCFCWVLFICYEARTLLGLGVSWCRTRVLSDIDTCNYTELCDFFQIINCVSVRIRAS